MSVTKVIVLLCALCASTTARQLGGSQDVLPPSAARELLSRRRNRPPRSASVGVSLTVTSGRKTVTARATSGEGAKPKKSPSRVPRRFPTSSHSSSTRVARVASSGSGEGSSTTYVSFSSSKSPTSSRFPRTTRRYSSPPGDVDLNTFRIGGRTHSRGSSTGYFFGEQNLEIDGYASSPKPKTGVRRSVTRSQRASKVTGSGSVRTRAKSSVRVSGSAKSVSGTSFSSSSSVTSSVRGRQRVSTSRLGGKSG